MAWLRSAVRRSPLKLDKLSGRLPADGPPRYPPVIMLLAIVLAAGVASSHPPRFSFSSTDSPRLSVIGRSPQRTQSFQRLRGGSVAAITLAEELQLCLNLLQAAVLGSVIGVERGWAGRPAGIRTMSMVCMGAALFTGVAERPTEPAPT